jgi:hypothetical protein
MRMSYNGMNYLRVYLREVMRRLNRLLKEVVPLSQLITLV